jgi:CBS domain-containing protein
VHGPRSGAVRGGTDVRIRTIYSERPLAVQPINSLATAAARMAENGVSALAVTEGTQLAGILTERDLVRAMVEGRVPERTQVREYMALEPHTAHPDDDTQEVASRMLELGVRHLPVLVDDRLVGMISARDLLLMEVWQDPRPVQPS